MIRSVAFVTLMFLLPGCGGDDSQTASANEMDTKAEDGAEIAKQATGTGRDPRWVIAIEGLPEKSGRIITAVTMGGNGRYSLGRSGFTASISVTEHDPVSDMMFTFSEENVRCFSQGDGMVTIDGDRAVVSGEVQCMPKDGGQKSGAAIEGWFELEK